MEVRCFKPSRNQQYVDILIDNENYSVTATPSKLYARLVNSGHLHLLLQYFAYSLDFLYQQPQFIKFSNSNVPETPKNGQVSDSIQADLNFIRVCRLSRTPFPARAQVKYFLYRNV